MNSIYAAFISYTWKADSQLAAILNDNLRVIESPVRKRRGIFHDKTEIPKNWVNDDELSQALTDALKSSDCFILLACPDSAKSGWVEFEVSSWLRLNALERLVIVATNNETGRALQYEDFPAILPPSLRQHFDQGWSPIALDLTQYKNADPETLKQAFMKLVAASDKVPYNDIYVASTRKREHALRNRYLIATILITVIGTLILYYGRAILR